VILLSIKVHFLRCTLEFCYKIELCIKSKKKKINFVLCSYMFGIFYHNFVVEMNGRFEVMFHFVADFSYNSQSMNLFIFWLQFFLSTCKVNQLHAQLCANSTISKYVGVVLLWLQISYVHIKSCSCTLVFEVYHFQI
jgi:hypothetical protein